MSVHTAEHSGTPPTLTAVMSDANQDAAIAQAELPESILVLKDASCHWLVERLNFVLKNTDTKLVKLTSSDVKQVELDGYFHAVRVLRSHRNKVVQRFKLLVESYFSAWLQEPKGIPVLKAENLSVVGNEDMDQLLAIEAMVTKGLTKNKISLSVLLSRIENNRFHDTLENFPVSPRNICTAIAQAFEPLNLSVNSRLVLLEEFDIKIVDSLPALYEALNKKLAKQGLLPQVPEYAPSEDATKGNAIEDAASKADIEIAEAEQSLKPNKKNEADAKTVTGSKNEVQVANIHTPPILTEVTAATDTSTSDTFAFDKAEQNSNAIVSQKSKAKQAPKNKNERTISVQALADITAELNALQSGISSCSPLNPWRAPTNDELLQVLDQLQTTVKPASLNQPGSLMAAMSGARAGLTSDFYKTPQGQTLKLVDGVFSSMWSQKQLSRPLKELLAKMQLPLAKAAVLDDEKLFHPDHGARKLVNALADAGKAFYGESQDNFKTDPLYCKMTDIVNRAVSDFDTSSGLFDELVSDLTTFTKREQKRLDLLEKRIIEAEAGRAKSEKARLIVAKTIVDICGDKDLRSAINIFIHRAWHQVLFVTCLKHGTRSPLWKDVVLTMSRVIELIQNIQDVTDSERARLAFPGLVTKIKRGFELIAFDPFEGDQLIGQLAQLLDSVRQGQVDEAGSFKGVFCTSDKNTSDLPIAAVMTSKLNAKKQRSIAEAKAAKTVDAQYFEQAKAVVRGDWFDYKKRGEPIIRCRLAAIIDGTSTYIFVNRSGQKVMEKTLLALAFGFKSGEIKSVINDPLFDRVLEEVIVNMRKADEPTLEEIWR